MCWKKFKKKKKKKSDLKCVRSHYMNPYKKWFQIVQYENEDHIVKRLNYYFYFLKNINIKKKIKIGVIQLYIRNFMKNMKERPKVKAQ